MQQPATQRRLAAILAADVVGFSRLMGADEEGTLARLKRLRAELIDPAVAEFHGRIFKTTGDGILAEFSRINRGQSPTPIGADLGLLDAGIEVVCVVPLDGEGLFQLAH